MTETCTPPVPRIKRSPELADKICDMLTSGFSLRYICSELGFSTQFVLNWLKADNDFVAQYARARQSQAELLADQVVELADSATPETANQVRLQVDTRKWIASKLYAKVYGDRPAEINISNTTNVILISEEKRASLIERWHKLSEKQVKAGVVKVLPA